MRTNADPHVELPAASSGAGADRGLRDVVLYCLKVFLAVRLATWVFALISVAVLPHAPPGGLDSGFGFVPGPVGVPGWPAQTIAPGWHNLFTAFERFDALWYLRIAAHGYGSHDGSAAFYPLFPLATRVVSFLIGGHPFAAGLIVSNGALLGGLVVLYLLTRSELSQDAARASVVFAAVFPTAFFFWAPYSESLFLLLVLVAFWAARRNRWLVAGAAGALAALTRNIGALLVLPLAVEAVHQAVEGHRGLVRKLACSAGPAVGAGAFLLYWELRVNDWLAPVHQQVQWQRTLASPTYTLTEGTRDAVRFLGIYPGGYHLLDWLIAVPVLVLAVYAAARFRPAYGVYVWAMILPPMAYIFQPRPFMSFPRFALPLFPVYWAMARLTERSRVRRELVVAVSAGLLGLLLLLFANWYYVF